MTTDFEDIVANHKKFNGKPFSHWQAQADELVVESLMWAGLAQDERSLIGYIAGKRLLEIAKTENPSVFEKLLKVRATCQAGFARTMASIFS